MNSETNSAGEFQQARSAGAAELRFRLAGAGPAYLQGALQNPDFGEEHLAPILSNPALPPGLIQQIAGNRQWLARYEVQRAVVFHRNSPRALKQNLIHFLLWKDLAKVAEDPLMPPPVKRTAETLLKARVEEMALGEKIALARIAGPGVIPSLRSDPHPDVVTALLGNPRLAEDGGPGPLRGGAGDRGGPVGGRVPPEVAEPLPGEDGAPPKPPHAGDASPWPSWTPSPRPTWGRLPPPPKVPRLVRVTAKQILGSRPSSLTEAGPFPRMQAFSGESPFPPRSRLGPPVGHLPCLLSARP